ncbi:hypothetical protein QA649_08110 [Bradyrhizobium sp. CB1717]|uniref:hypothetical protein n=1 Tax=Bradyrhizobium sp. CB1717 TaxID=3039154 RepID=UPI0024B15EFA|nr:hypothetical protein [Bradyrhizobium sp. CB1717]WFU29127.1 hypothetical protein QA649_08110 [Bradyrhizobium sp. CB1717]
MADLDGEAHRKLIISVSRLTSTHEAQYRSSYLTAVHNANRDNPSSAIEKDQRQKHVRPPREAGQSGQDEHILVAHGGISENSFYYSPTNERSTRFQFAHQILMEPARRDYGITVTVHKTLDPGSAPSVTLLKANLCAVTVAPRLAIRYR